MKKDEFINPPTTGYENLKSLGLEHIEDPQIRNMLKGIYEFLYPRLSKSYQFYPEMDACFSEYYLQHFKVLTDTTLKHLMITDTDTIQFPVSQTFQGVPVTRHIGFVPLDFESLKQDPTFMNMLRESLDFRLYKLSRYTNLIRLSEETLDMIRKEAGESHNG